MHTREQSPRQCWMAVLARASAADLAPFESALRDCTYQLIRPAEIGMTLVRGRMGGIKLACAPEDISIGAIVRSTEKDFAVVECHDANALVDCAILPFCNLKSGFKRAIDAFLSELDQMTLAASIKSMSSAAGVLGLAGVQPVKVALPKSRAKPSDVASAPKRRVAAAPKRAAKKTASK